MTDSTRFEWTEAYCKYVGLDDISLHDFQGVAVAAHRALALKEIAANHIGPWMHQYGQYIMETGAMEVNARKRFLFDPELEYKFNHINHADLAAAIFTSSPHSAAKRFAKMWDNAIEAMDRSMAPRKTVS